MQEQPRGKVTPRQLTPKAGLGGVPSAADDANTFGILGFYPWHVSVAHTPS